MTTIELKKLLIHKITEINDVSFLKAVKTILDSKTDTEVLLLTSEQKREIMESKKEIEQGLYMIPAAKTKSKLSTLRGKLTKQSKKEIDHQISDLRSEWDRNI